MSATPLRKRVRNTTLIYSVLLIGLVFILTWRTQVAQREIEQVVVRQAEAVEVLHRSRIFHAGLQTAWARAASEGPEAFAAALDRYAGLSGQVRAELARAEGVPREVAAESEVLDRLAVSTRERLGAMDDAERRASVETLRRQAARIADLSDAGIRAANEEIRRGMNRLVRAGRDTMGTGLGAAWIIAVIGVAVATNALKKVVRPIESLSRAADAIADGRYETRAPVAGDREVADLGRAFNSMAAQVESAVQARETMARTDDLTQLPNFRAFSEMIAMEIDRAARYGHRFGLLVFDIDHFKKYNDSYGHLAGNEALHLVSSTIRKTLRTVDTAARYGGEEFAAILPQVDEEAMHQIGERTRRAVQNLAPIDGRRRITVSAGGAIYPEDGLTADALFQSADKRLYEAKEKGRNMVVTPLTWGAG